jgi:benzoate membrane transport protein
MAGQFNYPELIGANLMARLLTLVLGTIGVGGRIIGWLPLPLAMGMLAGNLLGGVSQIVNATVQDVLVAGVTVAGYAVGRASPVPIA